jgi:hypothetical protein
LQPLPFKDLYVWDAIKSTKLEGKFKISVFFESILDMAGSRPVVGLFFGHGCVVGWGS